MEDSPKSVSGVRTVAIPPLDALTLHLDVYAAPGDDGLVLTAKSDAGRKGCWAPGSAYPRPTPHRGLLDGWQRRQRPRATGMAGPLYPDDGDLLLPRGC